MTATSAVTVQWEQQRAELLSVLASQEFVRAPKLASLLSYLCEKLFAGDASQIKEYSIGLEVFNRGASFDQDSDSIVRVEANRLRKRLAEYYAGEGASHSLQITIPVGQYVPRFEMRNSAPENGPTNAASAESRSKDVGAAAGSHWLRSKGAFGAGFLLLIAAAVLITYSVTKHRNEQKEGPDQAAARLPAEISDGQFGPPSGEEIRILAGATRSLVDHAGKLWSADVAFTGGTEVKAPAQHIERTLDPAFYRTSRQGQFRYDIPLKNAVYELRLHFAETTYGPETTGTGGEGSRLMTMSANGQNLLTHFDVIGDAGASQMADVKVFAGIRPGSDGKLHLEFAGEEGKPAMLSAIEIVPGVGNQIRPVRVVARQSPYYSNDSHWWSPDNYFEGGQIASYAQEVTGTDDPELYETERWGNFSYAIPVSQGRYILVLHFAVRHNNPGRPETTGADGSSVAPDVFSVFCNGKTLLENFDLRKAAGGGDVVIRKFSDLESNAQGKLMLSFVPVTGHARVTGIEVLPEPRR